MSVGYDKDLQEVDLIRLMNKNFKGLLDQSPDIQIVSLNSWSEYEHLSVRGNGGILLINPKLFEEM